MSLLLSYILDCFTHNHSYTTLHLLGLRTLYPAKRHRNDNQLLSQSLLQLLLLPLMADFVSVPTPMPVLPAKRVDQR